jgi:hypothetical protein
MEYTVSSSRLGRPYYSASDCSVPVLGIWGARSYSDHSFVFHSGSTETALERALGEEIKLFQIAEQKIMPDTCTVLKGNEYYFHCSIAQS